MGRSNIPVKTNEGALEIKARALGLAPRIRTALLLVDGVKSVAELERLMAAAGVTPGALQLLIDKGLIRFQDEAQSKAAAARPAPIPESDAAAATAVSAEMTLVPIEAKPVEPVKIHAAPAQLASATKDADKFEHKSEMLEPEPEFLIEVPPFNVARRNPVTIAPNQAPATPEPDLFPEEIIPAALKGVDRAPKSDAALPLEVATLIELETILGEVTKMEMDTILGVATKLELTPTQLLTQQAQMPRTAVQTPPAAALRLPPLAQAEYDFKMAAITQKHVIPAAVLRMNLTVARAHLACALDQHVEIDGYALKQRVVACEARADLEQLFRLVEGALMQKLDRSAVSRIMGVAQALLER